MEEISLVDIAPMRSIAEVSNPAKQNPVHLLKGKKSDGLTGLL